MEPPTILEAHPHEEEPNHEDIESHFRTYLKRTLKAKEYSAKQLLLPNQQPIISIDCSKFIIETLNQYLKAECKGQRQTFFNLLTELRKVFSPDNHQKVADAELQSIQLKRYFQSIQNLLVKNSFIQLKVLRLIRRYVRNLVDKPQDSKLTKQGKLQVDQLGYCLYARLILKVSLACTGVRRSKTLKLLNGFVNDSTQQAALKEIYQNPMVDLNLADTPKRPSTKELISVADFIGHPQWQDKLLQLIINETLVDKKFQEPEQLKATPLLARFVSKHFEHIHSQLERLLIKSEANIEVWAQFFSGLGTIHHIDPFVMVVLKKSKNYLKKNYAATALIFEHVSQGIMTKGTMTEVIELISSLLAEEYNVKSKMGLLLLLKGVIHAAKSNLKQEERSSVLEQLLLVISDTWFHFVEQEEYLQMLDLLALILPFICDPTPRIAAQCLQSALRAHRYVRVYCFLTVALLYKGQLASSIKDCLVGFRKMMMEVIAKPDANWQWLVIGLNAVSQVEPKILEQADLSLAIYKATSISLPYLQRLSAAQLIVKQVLYMQQNEDQIPNQLFVSLAVTLETTRSRSLWQHTFTALSDDLLIRLCAQGIYPLLLFPCPQLKINSSGNSFKSLMSRIIRCLRAKIQINNQNSVHFLTCAEALKCPQLTVAYSHNTQLVEKIAEITTAIYLTGGKTPSIELPHNVVAFYTVQLRQLLQLFKCSYFQNMFRRACSKSFYVQKLEEQIEIEKDWHAMIADENQHLTRMRNSLEEQGLYRHADPKPKKVYIGWRGDVKMMSEAEVKAEKYHIHSLKMQAQFNIQLELIRSCSQSYSYLSPFWINNYDELLGVSIFNFHRLSLSGFVTRSIESAVRHMNQTGQSPITRSLFHKFSIFLGDFMKLRGVNHTPSMHLMEYCQKFLEEVISILDSSLAEPLKPNLLLDTPKQFFVAKLINYLCVQVLDNMEYDINLKKLSVRFIWHCHRKLVPFGEEKEVFTLLVKNVNILSMCRELGQVLANSMRSVDSSIHRLLFDEILNYVTSTQILILKVVNNLSAEGKYKPSFEEFIKLRILGQRNEDELNQLAHQILEKEIKRSQEQGAEGSHSESLLNFDLKRFMQRNSKDTVEKLFVFIKQEITKKDQVHAVFQMVLEAAESLYDSIFDQQGLEMFPYFLNLNLLEITPTLFKPIFKLLVNKFAASEEYVTLSSLSRDAGIEIIKEHGRKHAVQLLQILEGQLDKTSGISNIVFLGVLAPFLPQNDKLRMVSSQITNLFNSDNEPKQQAISKCMPDLMSFFKDPMTIVQEVMKNIATIARQLQIGQSYLVAGLLKGIGPSECLTHLDKVIAEDYPSKTTSARLGRLSLLKAFIINFGRLVELKISKLIQVLVTLMADSIQEVRAIAKSVSQILISKISSFAVKTTLPSLLKGLEEEKNWKMQISYIWNLGYMANCSAKQLQASLPIIVQTLSSCLSNAHPAIRQSASEAMSLIGQTVKNPEITESIEILIDALKNPFEKSEKALQILKKTKFSHYVDAPSLSLVIPIIDYCLRGRSSELKLGASQIIGSIVNLIKNPSDMLPYLKIVSAGLKVALCDPLPNIRSIAAMAIGCISSRIGIQDSQIHFKFISDILESPTSNTTEKNGAAQAYSELICSHDFEFFEESMNSVFEKLQEAKHAQKEGWILVFLYVPCIRKDDFETFILDVNKNMYGFVSDEDENIRNSAMMVEKVLINNYSLSHTDLLLEPLCEGIYDNNWRRRNAAIILLGELLNVLKIYAYNCQKDDKNYAYYQALMAVYIIKDDELEMPRLTANQVWNNYIDNTPRTIKIGLKDLIKMWTRWSHCENGIVMKNIISFSSKYGDNYFTEMLAQLKELVKIGAHQRGVFQVMSEFLKRLTVSYLTKEPIRVQIRGLFRDNADLLTEGKARQEMAKCLCLYVEKTQEEAFFQELVLPKIDDMATVQEGSTTYMHTLHWIRDLLQTTLGRAVQRLIQKIAEPPFFSFKIECITNNASRVANHMYSLFKVPVTNMFVAEALSTTDNSRATLIAYCLNQVANHLNPKLKIQYLSHLLDQLHKRDELDPKQMASIAILAELVVSLLSSSQLTEFDDLDKLISQFSRLIFSPSGVVSRAAHKVLLMLILDQKGPKTADYMKQILVCFDNSDNKPAIWPQEGLFKEYVNLVVRNLAYGTVDVMEQSLFLLQFMVRNGPKKLVSEQIMRIVGPVLRVLSYPLFVRYKLTLVDFIAWVHKQGFSLTLYATYISTMCYRLLHEFKDNSQLIEAVSSMLLIVIGSSPNKADTLISIFNRLKAIGTPLIECSIFLLRSIITSQLTFPKQVLERLRSMYSELLDQTESKLSLKASYFCTMGQAVLETHLMQQPLTRFTTVLSGITCSYESILLYLHCVAESKAVLSRVGRLEVFLRQTPKQKLCYILRGLLRCLQANVDSRDVYTGELVRSLVPENVSGFEEVNDLLEQFD